MNNRRKLIVALGAGALAGPFGSFAQQTGKVWRVGVLVLQSRAASLDPQFSGSFPLNLRDLGYVDGKNLAIEWRYADGNPGLLSGLAAELVQWKPDVLVGGGSAAVVALQKATATIPIVMIVVVDPVADGLVRSLARPGGNITGFTTLAVDLGPKRLEMLHAMVPNLSRVAVLYAPVNESTQNTPQSIVAAAQKLGIKILPVAARTPEEIDKAFALMRKQDAGAVMVLLNPFFQQQKDQIAALAMKHRLPAMTADQMYAQAGCLMSYGSSFVYAFQRVATYVDKILKGARPAELPVEQPTTFELVINGKTAKTLGLKIPNSILVQATKVIE